MSADGPRIEPYPTEAAWLAARKTGVGSSDTPILTGLSDFKSPWQLWAERVGLAELDPQETEYQKWGRRLQAPILAGYADETGRIVRNVQNVLYRDPARAWLIASPDGFIQQGGQDLAPVEAKNVSSWKGEDWEESAPPLYLVQVQHQLLVTRAEYAVLVALIGGNRLRHLEVRPNLRLQEVILEAVETFWTQVQREIPPPVDGSDATRKILMKAFGRPEPEKYISLPGAAAEWDREWQRLDAEIKEAEKAKGEIENRLRAEIGNAWGGELPGGVKWTNALVKRAEYTVPASEYRRLSRSKQDTKKRKTPAALSV